MKINNLVKCGFVICTYYYRFIISDLLKYIKVLTPQEMYKMLRNVICDRSTPLNEQGIEILIEQVQAALKNLNVNSHF